MKKSKIVTIFLICLVAIMGGAIFFVLFASKNPSPVPSSGQSQPDPKPAVQTSAQQVPGSYQAYSATDFANTKAPRRVLFFHAGWCPQCRMLEQSIQQTGVPDNMAIFKVDFDNSQDLRQKYGVTMQTTFVEVSASGELVKKHVAYFEPNLPGVIKALGGE